MRWSVEEYFKSHSTDYKKPLEISYWDALECLKSLLKWPISANLSLKSNNKVMARKTLKHLTKLLDRLRGIGRGYRDGHGIPKCSPCPSVFFFIPPGPSVRFRVFFEG